MLAATIRADRLSVLLPWTARNAHRGWEMVQPEAASDRHRAGSGAASCVLGPLIVAMTGADAFTHGVRFGS